MPSRFLIAIAVFLVLILSGCSESRQYKLGQGPNAQNDALVAEIMYYHRDSKRLRVNLLVRNQSQKPVYGLLGGTDPSNFVLLTDQGTRYVGQLYRGEKNSTSIAGMIREGVNAARDIMVTVRKSKSGEDLRTVEFRPGEQEFKLVFWPEEKGSFKADDWTFRVINLRNQDETSLGELVIPKPR